MANLQNTQKYIQKRTDVINKLTIKGFLCSFGILLPSIDGLGGISDNYLESLTIPSIPLNDTVAFADDILLSDVFLFSAGYETELITHAIVNGTRYKKHKVIEFRPDDNILIYNEIQLRI